MGIVLNLVLGFVDLFTEGCDGWLAAGLHGFNGSGICLGSMITSGIDSSSGAEDEELFGIIPGIICNIQRSLYNVSWSAAVSNAPL